MKRILITSILCMMVAVFSFAAVAAETSLKAEYDAATETLVLSGNACGYATVRITPYTDHDLAAVPTDIFQLAVNGKYTYKLYMPDAADFGKYLVYLSDDVSTASDTFIYYDKTGADTITASINAADTKNEFVSAIKVEAASLGIDTEREEYSDGVLELMYELDIDYSDSSELYNNYNYCAAICSLTGKSDAELLENMQKYEDILGIDYSADYDKNTALTSSAKLKLTDLISEMDYAAELKAAEDVTGYSGFKAVLSAKGALAALNSTDSWKEMKEIYTSDFPFLNQNVVKANGDYSSSASSKVFSALAKLSFESIDDLSDNFDEAVDSVASGSSSGAPSGKGSSGGGGGSSWSAPAVNNSAVYDEAPDVKETIPTEAAVPMLSDGTTSYTDVNESDWYSKPVWALSSSGIVSGDPNGAFRPNDNITRAEFAKLIVTAFSVKGESKSFADVAEDAWYEPYVSVAAGVGILQGYEGRFNPGLPITRQDAAVIIYRTSDILGIRYNGFTQPKDINDASVYAWTAIGSLYTNGIINGMGDGRFAPLDSITRAQAAQLIYSTIADMQTR